MFSTSSPRSDWVSRLAPNFITLSLRRMCPSDSDSFMFIFLVAFFIYVVMWEKRFRSEVNSHVCFRTFPAVAFFRNGFGLMLVLAFSM